MTRKRWLGLVGVIVYLGLASARGALPPLSPEELRDRATHIVVGQVRAVYSTEKPGAPGFVDRRYCIEIVPSAIEKGEGLKEGKVIYARTWRPAKRPTGWAGPQGQNEIPKDDQRVRMFMTEGKDGGFDLLGPNGWEPVKEPAGEK